MLRRKKAEKGLSLVEAMIAVTVLGISMLALGQLFGVALQQGGLARNSNIGLEVARGKLEELNTAFNQQLESGVTSELLTDGKHGPQTVLVETNGSRGTEYRPFSVSWVVDEMGIQKVVSLTVEPEHDLNSQGKPITVTSVFTP